MWVSHQTLEFLGRNSVKGLGSPLRDLAHYLGQALDGVIVHCTAVSVSYRDAHPKCTNCFSMYVHGVGALR